MNIVGNAVTVILLMLPSNFAQSSKNLSVSSCETCMRYFKRIPPPELLWATSQHMVLRSRLACSRWCPEEINWLYSVPIDSSGLQWKKKGAKRDSQGYYVMEEESGTKIKVQNTFYLHGEGNYLEGENIIATICPGPKILPPAPKEVECWWHNENILLIWRQEPDVCHSYAYYMVRTRNEGMKEFGDWWWIGEVPPGRRGYEDADNVRPCPDKPHLLCAKFPSSSRVLKLQLGVVRMDQIIGDKSISKANDVDCLVDEILHQLSSSTTSSSIVFTSSAETTTPIPKSSSKINDSPWRSIAFVLLGVLVVMVVLLPLTFFAGIRWQKMRSINSNKTSATSWEHLNGNNQLNWNRTLGRQELICNEAPPDYAYDYTYIGLLKNQARQAEQQRSAPTRPLPPRPQGQTEVIQNDIYIPGTICEPGSNNKKITSEHVDTG